MKKILLTIIGLALASTAWSAQTAVTPISGTQASVGALKTQVNTKLGTVESNRQDHETRVAAMETGKANASAFASQSAFTTAWGWTPGGISAWSDVQALISGTGDYIKYDGTRGNPTASFDLSAYLSKTNTTAFTPSGDYHPATKKYVDDSITAGGGYTDEQAQDAVGGMFTGNTETGITVTYDDTTGKVNFVVATQSDVNFTSTLNTKLAGIATGAEVNVNADWNSSSGDSQILNKPTIPTVSDTAYGSGWNGDTGAASKNAIYDKIETLSGSSSQDWLPSTGPTDGRQILQATGGCSNATYSAQATCEAASATWTTPVYQNTSIISGLINDTGTANDDLWSAAKITGELAGKQNTLAAGTDYLTPAAAASTYQPLAADLTTAAGASTAGASKYFGTDSGGSAGFYDLPTGSGSVSDTVYGSGWNGDTTTAPSKNAVYDKIESISAGSFAFDTFPAYEDSAHSSGIAVNGTTLAVYSSSAGKWLTAALSDSLDPTPDLTPNAFTFTDVTDAELSTQYTALAQITGITGGITCSGSGGTVAACTGSTEGTCGTFGSTSGSITNNQYVGIRQTSSASNGTATNSIATCGGVSDTFTVTTADAVASCSTQSVLLGQTDANLYNREVYDQGIAARITGNGQPLYSVKSKTGGIAGGTPGTWTVYINTSLNFSGTVTESFPIFPPGAANTEFSATSVTNPVLENGVTYYIGFYKAGSGWNDRAVFSAINGIGTTPANNYWEGPITDAMTQATNSSLWLEVKTCD